MHSEQKGRKYYANLKDSSATTGRKGRGRMWVRERLRAIMHRIHLVSYIRSGSRELHSYLQRKTSRHRVLWALTTGVIRVATGVPGVTPER